MEGSEVDGPDLVGDLFEAHGVVLEKTTDEDLPTLPPESRVAALELRHVEFFEDGPEESDHLASDGGGGDLVGLPGGEAMIEPV